MKERIKKALKRITPNLVLMWLNLVAFVYHIVLSFTHGMWEVAMIGTPFLIIALLAFDLHEKDKKILKLREEGIIVINIALRALRVERRYRELYGELPEEEPESEKQNSDNLEADQP